jgi:hypothetical protein
LGWASGRTYQEVWKFGLGVNEPRQNRVRLGEAKGLRIMCFPKLIYALVFIS